VSNKIKAIIEQSAMELKEAKLMNDLFDGTFTDNHSIISTDDTRWDKTDDDCSPLEMIEKAIAKMREPPKPPHLLYSSSAFTALVLIAHEINTRYPELKEKEIVYEYEYLRDYKYLDTDLTKRIKEEINERTTYKELKHLFYLYQIMGIR
jgi:hypothetical protein